MRTFEAIIVLADISGYTKFVVLHRASLMHAEQIITELMEAVTKHAEFPLTIQKLEGDAAFMTAEVSGAPEKAVNDVMRQVVEFMDLFRQTQERLFDRSVGGCPCTACQRIEDLSLKCVVHMGRVLEKRVGQLCELAGEPVIVAHRLMKNSVGRDAYILVTDPVLSCLDFAPYADQSRHTEQIEDVGSIETTAFFPGQPGLDRGGVKPLTKPNLEGIRLYFSLFADWLRRRRRPFRNLPG